jgi:hypothetical protein
MASRRSVGATSGVLAVARPAPQVASWALPGTAGAARYVPALRDANDKPGER